MTRDTRTSSEEPRAAAERLESWKEIAVYLKRGVRTVRRWEKDEGLPVHRHLHQKLGTVYAHRDEINAWWEGRRGAARSPAVSVHRTNRREPARLMVAILPFESLAGNAERDYFAEGLTDELIAELGRFHPARLGVIARTTMMHYKGAPRTVRQIGEELGVDYVLDGRVRREGDRVRVTAQLSQVEDQAHVWSGSYDQTIRSILTLQREIAGDIVRGIRRKLPQSQDASPLDAPSVEPASYDAYLKGRHFLNDLTSESVRRSVEYLRQAVALDPTHAAAHAALAEAYAQLSVWTDVPSVETLPLALEAAQNALALDPNLAEAHASLGLIHANHVWDWPKAEHCFERALELNPGCVPAGQWYAEFLAELGRIDKALAVIDQAHKHDPLSLTIRSSRAFVFWLGGRFDEAMAEAERVLEVDPQHATGLIRLGVARAAKGLYDGAAEAFRTARDATPGLLDCRSLLGYAHARAGRVDAARAQLDELRQLATRRYVPAFLFANIHLGLGEDDEALRLIEEEYQHRGWYLLLIKQSPLYGPIRSNPRFQALLARMNFPE